MNRQNLYIYAGENDTLTLFARNSSNNVPNIYGQTIDWRVGKTPFEPGRRSAVLDKTATIVSTTAGSYSVSI